MNDHTDAEEPDEGEHEMPDELKKLTEMMGGMVLPVGPGVMSNAIFAQTIAAMLRYIILSGFILKNRKTPDKMDDPAAAKLELDSKVAAIRFTCESLDEHFTARLNECGYSDEAATSKLATMLSLLAVYGTGMGEMAQTLLHELSDREIGDKITKRTQEIAEQYMKEAAEAEAKEKADKAEEEKHPQPPGHRFVKFDRAKMDALKTEYDAAIKADKLSFMFDGSEWDIGYAKYAIAYLAEEMAKKGM